MIFEFATKRDINGNRYYLGIDTDLHVFSKERGHWYSRDEIIEISKTDYRRLIENCENSRMFEIDYFSRRVQ